jgi:hypothetical protein
VKHDDGLVHQDAVDLVAGLQLAFGRELVELAVTGGFDDVYRRRDALALGLARVKEAAVVLTVGFELL